MVVILYSSLCPHLGMRFVLHKETYHSSLEDVDFGSAALDSSWLYDLHCPIKMAEAMSCPCQT